MKIFILGCGFVGSKLAAHFKSCGHIVTVSTTSESKVDQLKAISDEVVVLRSNTDLTPYLAHQEALIVSAAPKDKEDYEGAYYQTAIKVKEALSTNTHIRAVYYTSSCSVYGEKKGEWVDETHRLEPLNHQQKILAETEKVYLNQLPSQVKVCLFRLGEIYGLEKSMQEKIQRLNSINKQVNGDSYTNLIHVVDIVRALEWAMQKGVSGIFNLCNDSHETRRDFYCKWCQHLNLQEVQFTTDHNSYHRGNKRVSNHKIKLMGFEFEHPTADPF